MFDEMPTDTNFYMDKFKKPGKSQESPSDAYKELIKAQKLLNQKKKVDPAKLDSTVHTTRMQMLLEINRKVNSILEIDELLSALVDQVIKFTNADRGILLLYKDYQSRILASITGKTKQFANELIVKVARDNKGNQIPNDKVEFSSSLIDEVIESGQAKFVVDAPTHQKYSAKASVLALKLKSMMCAPLLLSGRHGQQDKDADNGGHKAPMLPLNKRIIGILYVDNKNISTPYSRADLDIFQSIANNASIAIENAGMHQRMVKLYKNAVENQKRIQMLYDVQRGISSTLDLDSVLNTIMDYVIQVTQAERGFLMLKDDEGRLQFKVARNMKMENLNKQNLKLSWSVVEKVARFGEPEVIENLANQAISTTNLPISMVDLQLKTVMCVPLRTPQFERNKVSGTTTSDILRGTIRELEDELAKSIIGVVYVDSRAIVNTFKKEDLDIFMTFASQAAISIQNAQLYKLTEDQFVDTVRALAAAIDAKDPYTHGHSERVAKFSIAIGRELGMTKTQLKDLRLAALFHDIGKIGIPDRILCKPSTLDDEEYSQMKRHPTVGTQIVGKIKTLKNVSRGMEHHEKIDGSGYPNGLKADEISVEGRIIAVADAFDAMTSDRPYRKGLKFAFALRELKRMSGVQFDAEMVGAFERAYLKGNLGPDDKIDNC